MGSEGPHRRTQAPPSNLTFHAVRVWTGGAFRALVVPMKRFAIALIMVSPLLRGAGCTAHYGAHLNAEINVPQETKSAPILVKFRLKQPDSPPCAPDWDSCLRRHREWRMMNNCLEEPEQLEIPGKKPQTRYNFEVCTGMVGVDYQADVMAFLDANNNDKLDLGEPYGLYAKNPLTRDTEPESLSIALDQKLKPAPSP